MPVRKFRSVEAMNQPVWRTPGDPELFRAIEELDEQVQRWQQEHVERRRRGGS